MKEMTLDEAIQHCEEVAEENEKFCYKKGGEGGYFNEDTDWDNTKCAAEHRQLVVWLKDYKRLLERESCKDAISRETVKTEYKRRLESSLKDESKGIDLTHLADCTKFNEFIDSIPPVNSQHCEDAVSRKEVAEFLRNHAKDFEDARVKMAFMAASSLVENTNNVPSVTPVHIEQEPVLDKIRAEIASLSPKPTAYDAVDGNPIKDAVWETLADVLQIIDKYKESEE